MSLPLPVCLYHFLYVLPLADCNLNALRLYRTDLFSYFRISVEIAFSALPDKDEQ